MSSADLDPVARLPEAWRAELSARGEPGFRAEQVFRWIHERGVFDPTEMTDLPKSLRQTLERDGLGSPLELERVHGSADGARKLLLRTRDASSIETVLLPTYRPEVREQDADAAVGDAADDDDEGDEAARGARVTQCISTQVGCAMGCVFCASGVAGLERHLSVGEIVGQVLLGRRQLDEGERLRAVVFMGMGEPLHNYAATAQSIRLLTHPKGIGLSPRRITVSTSGLCDGIARLGKDFEGQVGLAISLHHADDEARSALVPINRTNPLPKLMAALRAYPLPHRRHITVEYTLIAGQNDQRSHALALARLLEGLRVQIQLIPMNPIAASPLRPPTEATVLAFQRLMRERGYLCFVRRRRGDDVAAACGQLALAGAGPTKAFVRRQELLGLGRRGPPGRKRS